MTRIDHDWSAYDFAALASTYYNDELDVTIEVKHDNGRDFTITRKEREKHWAATMNNPDLLSWKGNPLTFIRDDSGEVVALSYSNDRVKHLRFVRKEGK